MAYQPTESLSVTWRSRNASWRRISPERRDIVTDLPVRLRGLSIADLPDNDAGRMVRAWCQRWSAFPSSGLALDGLEGDNRGVGLLLVGAPGRGKTTMAAVATQYVSDLGWSSKFIRAQDYYSLSLQVMRSKDEERQEELQSAFDCYEAGWDGWRCVALDDLGREHRTGSGWSENAIENLIRARFTDGAPTIVTTNLTEEEIAKRYGTAMGDYIHEAFWVVTVSGRSYRRVRR